ncbi:MAG: hypothetical protein EOL89_01785 [Actinobacteria bacterium]|nr:hypothetical protein [Actinomycetota bacterium]
MHSGQAVLGATLGTLLPLCFISDIFVVGADLPDVLDAIGWFFPLRHAARAMTDSVSTLGTPFPWTHLAVILAWLAVSLVVIGTRFRSEAVKDPRPALSAARG